MVAEDPGHVSVPGKHLKGGKVGNQKPLCELDRAGPDRVAVPTFGKAPCRKVCPRETGVGDSAEVPSGDDLAEDAALHRDVLQVNVLDLVLTDARGDLA